MEQNSRTEILTSTYKPRLAIMVYQHDNDYYLESHVINDEGQLLEGKPLLEETIQGMVDTFFDENKSLSQVQGLVPYNVLSYQQKPGGNYHLVWFRPAEIKVIHFAPQLKISTGKAWVPPMIYVASKDGLDVYCFAETTRPTEDTKLLVAPYHNVSDGGDVCLGNAKVEKPKEKTYSSLIKYWEDLFWLSEFSHTNGGNKTRSDMDELWRRIMASNLETSWDGLDELLPCEKETVKNLL